MKNLKLESGLLDRLTNITNRSKAQTQMLFDLCDCDFGKLLEVERKLKNNFVFWVPGDREALEYVLSLPDEDGWYKLNWLMCKPMGRVKEIPLIGLMCSLKKIKLSGLIVNELKGEICHSCCNLKFKDQWAVIWDKKELSEWIQNKGGLPSYWMDKDLFEIARPCYNKSGKLLWDWNYKQNKSIKNEKEIKIISI